MPMKIKKTEIEVEINEKELKALMPPTKPFSSKRYSKIVVAGAIVIIIVAIWILLPESVRKELPLKEIFQMLKGTVKMLKG